MTTCHVPFGAEGIMCEEGCLETNSWCSETGLVCTTAGGPVGVDNVDLCRNNTFWMDKSCKTYTRGVLGAVGRRCSSNKKHCTYPWYTWRQADPVVSPTCLDKSDQ